MRMYKIAVPALIPLNLKFIFTAES